MMKVKSRYIKLLIILVTFSLSTTLFAQENDTLRSDKHEITFYVIPQVREIKWDTPASLLKSAVSCYIHAGLRKNYYVLGHIITKVESPLLDSVSYFAMNGAVQTEKVSMLLNGKIGFGILGINMQGRMEPMNEALRSIEFYSKRDKVAFIRYSVNEEAISRILRFVDYYKSPNPCGVPHSKYYNGALNPIYENEGAACSSFGIALLDVADLLPEEAEEEWMVDINIPLELIGGEINDSHKVKWRRILKAKEWHSGEGIEGEDYAKYNVYDPIYIFDWIRALNKQGGDERFTPEKEGKIMGLYSDKSELTYENDEILKKRDDITFFVQKFFEEIKCAEETSDETEIEIEAEETETVEEKN